jgi:hypothetical protein
MMMDSHSLMIDIRKYGSLNPLNHSIILMGQIFSFNAQLRILHMSIHIFLSFTLNLMHTYCLCQPFHNAVITMNTRIQNNVLLTTHGNSDFCTTGMQSKTATQHLWVFVHIMFYRHKIKSVLEFYDQHLLLLILPCLFYVQKYNCIHVS